MASRWPSQAVRFRQARESFTLALELGCTPIEAAVEQERRRAACRQTCAAIRLAAIDARSSRRRRAAQQPTETRPEPARRFWWLEN